MPQRSPPNRPYVLSPSLKSGRDTRQREEVPPNAVHPTPHRSALSMDGEGARQRGEVAFCTIAAPNL
jgi:hypothetical protein